MFRWRYQKKTCGYEPTEGSTKSSAQQLVKFLSEFIVHRKQRILSHMWVVRKLIQRLVLVEYLENIKTPCDCNQTVKNWWVSKHKSKKNKKNPLYLYFSSTTRSDIWKDDTENLTLLKNLPTSIKYFSSIFKFKFREFIISFFFL